ncbi:hypothetical protein BH09SUM1_BH09SUM1_24590 [soil metagenome]
MNCSSIRFLMLILFAVLRSAGAAETSGTLPLTQRPTLVIVPFFENDVVTSQSNTVAYFTSRHIAAYLPGSIALPNYGEITDDLGYMRIFTLGNVQRNEEHIATIIRYEAGTHVLRGALETTADKWTFRGEIKYPGGSTPIVEEAAAREDLILAQKVAHAAMAGGHFPLTDAQIARIDTPVMGVAFRTSLDGAMPQKGRHVLDPALREGLLAENNLGGYFQFSRQFILDKKSQGRPFLARLQQSPLNAITDIPSVHQLRGKALDSAGDTAGAAAEFAISLKEAPGNYGLAQSIFNSGDLYPTPAEWEAACRTWYLTADKTPYTKSLFARNLSNIAYGYRGSGYANTVSQNSWAKFGALNLEAMGTISEVRDEVGLLPPVAWLIVELNCRLQNIRQARKVCEEEMKIYPDYLGTWTTYLNYMRPRWHGNGHTDAMAVLRYLLDSRPENPVVCTLQADYFRDEIWYFEGWKSDPEHAYNLLLHSVPGASEMAAENILRMTSQGGEWGAKEAAALAIMTQDYASLKDIMEQSPNAFSSIARDTADPLQYWTISSTEAELARQVGNWKALKSVNELQAANIEWRVAGTELFADPYYSIPTKSLHEYLCALAKNPAEKPDFFLIGDGVTDRNTHVAVLTAMLMIIHDHWTPAAEERWKIWQTSKKHQQAIEEKEELRKLWLLTEAVMAHRNGNAAEVKKLLAQVAEKPTDAYVWTEKIAGDYISGGAAKTNAPLQAPKEAEEDIGVTDRIYRWFQ